MTATTDSAGASIASPVSVPVQGPARAGGVSAETPPAGDVSAETSPAPVQVVPAPAAVASGGPPAVASGEHAGMWGTGAAALRPLLGHARQRGGGLTAPGGVLLALLVLTPGVAFDVAFTGSFGLASSVFFVLAGVAAALAVQVRALGTAAVLPPLLFVGAVGALAWLGGRNDGRRELVLDVGTTLAVSAPLLFGGTATVLAIVLGRLVLRVARR